MKYLSLFIVALLVHFNTMQANSLTTPTPKNTIHNQWHTLLQKHVSKTGKVNYKGFLEDKALLNTYITTLQNNTPKHHWLKENVLAYWINAYNALTVDLILQNYPTTSIKNIKKPWDQKLWEFDGNFIDLNTIEHKILRKMNEPRIHFAIVCASASCPKLENAAYTASDLEAQLTKATQQFLADSTKNKLSNDAIEISKIFKWFAKDFKTKGSVIDFINQYSNIKIADTAKISYANYSWKLNN